MSKSRARNWTSRFPAFFICRRQHDGSSDSALLYMQHGLVLQAAGDIAHLYEYTCRSASDNYTPVIPDGCIDVMFDITSEEISARAAGTVLADTRVPMEQGHPDFGIRFEPGVIPVFLDGAFRELNEANVCRSDSAALFSAVRDRIQELEDFTGYSARSIGRIFNTYAGMSPKTFAQFIRDFRKFAGTTPREYHRQIIAADYVQKFIVT